MVANESIRQAAKTHSVRLWEIAEALGIADTTFSRYLRREVSQEKTSEILKIIEQISDRREDV